MATVEIRRTVASSVEAVGGTETVPTIVVIVISSSAELVVVAVAAVEAVVGIIIVTGDDLKIQRSSSIPRPIGGTYRNEVQLGLSIEFESESTTTQTLSQRKECGWCFEAGSRKGSMF